LNMQVPIFPFGVFRRTSPPSRRCSPLAKGFIFPLFSLRFFSAHSKRASLFPCAGNTVRKISFSFLTLLRTLEPPLFRDDFYNRWLFPPSVFLTLFQRSDIFPPSGVTYPVAEVTLPPNFLNSFPLPPVTSIDCWSHRWTHCRVNSFFGFLVPSLP